MKRKYIVGLALSLAVGLVSNVSAVSVGDRVYVIFGSGSSARVESGNITSAGSSNSKVDWDYCSNCPDWVSNSSFYYSSSSAQARVNEMDANHTSVGEAAGAALVGGVLYCILGGCK